MVQAAEFVDFKVVKERVTVAEILTHYKLLESFTKKGAALYGPCPIHKGTNKGQFKIDPEGRRWYCFGRQCKVGGNVLDLVAKLEHVPVSQAARLIAGWFAIDAPHAGPRGARAPSDRLVEDAPSPAPAAAVAATAPVTEVPPPPPAPPVAPQAQPGETGEWVTPGADDEANAPLSFRLKHVDPTLPKFRHSGFAKETLELFGAGLFTGKGIIEGRLAVPVHNRAGELVAYIGRSLEGEPDIYPKGFRPQLELYNLHRALAGGRQVPELIVVPDVYDVWRVHEVRKGNAVALVAPRISPQQLALLRSCLTGPRRIIFIASETDDHRTAGIAATLASIGFVHWIKLPRNAWELEPSALAALFNACA